MFGFKIFELSTATKVSLMIFSTATLLFGIGYTLRPIAEIIDDLEEPNPQPQVTPWVDCGYGPDLSTMM
jgi:hypothetical protein